MLLLAIVFNAIPISVAAVQPHSLDLDDMVIRGLESGDPLEKVALQSNQSYPVYMVKIPDTTDQLFISGISGVVVGGVVSQTDIPDWFDLDFAAEYFTATPYWNGYADGDWESFINDYGASSKEELLTWFGVDAYNPPFFGVCTYSTADYSDGVYKLSLSTFSSLNKSQFQTYAPNLIYDETASYYLIDITKFCERDVAVQGTITETVASILVQVGGTDDVVVDKRQLLEAIDAVPETGFYTDGDRYNGRNTSTNGFWAEVQRIVSSAKSVYEDSTASQTEVDAAVATLDQSSSNSELFQALANCIPTTQVNATSLYEAVQAYQKLQESDYTTASWLEGERLYGQMTAMLDNLFDEAGNATEANTADKQDEVDALAQTPGTSWAWVVVNQGAYDGYYTVYEARRQEAQNLLSAYDPARLTESDYTPETWAAYTAAYDALKQDMEHKIAGGTRADFDMLAYFEPHLEALIDARLQLASSGDVTCSFTYVNNLISRYPAFREEGTALYENPSLTLAEGSTTVADALETAGITYRQAHDSTFPAGATNDSDTNALLAVYLNGEWVASSYVKDLGETAIQIPNNAEVLVVRYALPAEQGEASTGETTSEWITYPADSTADYSDSFARIGAELGQEEAKVGDKVTVTGSVTGASYSNLGEALGGEGLTLFVSEPSEEKTLSAPVKQTTAVTGAGGTLEYVFTRPGWYTVALFDLSEDVITATDIFQETTIGTYYSLRAGGYAQIHVTAVEDDAALLEQYRTENAAEAEAFFQQYHDYDFAAGYYEGTFVPLYNTLKANLATATDFVGLMDQYDADYAALRAAASAAVDHTAILAALRADLALIPSDLSAMDETYKTLVAGIQTAYAALNDYQKSLLTPNETSRLEQIAVLDTDSLTKLANVTVTFYKPGETEYPFATIQGTFSGTGGAAMYNWPNWNWTSHQRPNGIIPDPSWSDTRPYLETMTAKAEDYVYVRLYLNTTQEQYWPMWQVDGGDWQLFEPAVYGGVSGYYLATWQIPEDAAEGSSYHISLKMVSRTEYEEFLRTGDTEGLEQSKKTAIAALKAEYQQYRADSSLPAATLVKIEEAMTAGIEAVEAAQTNTEVAEARKAALSAMALAAGNTEDVGEVGYDSGETVGRVHVIMENTTYAQGAFYGPSSIADGWYTLGKNDSMMTVVLKVLESQGYTWTGTGGTTASDYDITYLSSVSKDGQTLAEKQGGTAAGWMGTLNDWFTNLGFHAFTYANGGLEDGDEIHIMFSLNAGEDLGGTWNNNDTRLAALEITSGTLAPAFSRDVTDYLLIVPDGYTTLRVEPEAVNKNFQTRIFLNSYDKDSARYKSGETISVTSGDALYVGVGESGWPTMNTGNRGTKYTIQVATLANAIASLPQDSQVTQSNYKVYSQTATILEAAVSTSGYQGDTTKLKTLRARVSFFEEIAEVERLISALPALETVQAAPDDWRETVNQANDAYQKLSVAQQAYLVSADVNKLTQAVEAVGGEQGGEDLEAVRTFNDKVDAIGTLVTVESENVINEAKAAYGSLTETQKALVAERYNTLCNAEAALAVVKQVAAIGEVTLESEAAITAARKAYTDYVGKFSGKDMVSNLSVLEDAEAALKALQEGGGDTSGYRTVMDEVLNYLSTTVSSPIVGSTNGEWAVLAQARAGTLSNSARTNYLANLRSYVQQRNGKLDQTTDQTLHTEYARVVLALAALGEDPEHFTVGSTTYDLVAPLLDTGKSYAYQVSEQGNNGTIWALIALDSAGYRNDEKGNAARKAWIDLLIDKQQADGNWPIYNPDQVDTGSGSDLGGVDVCAMALQALAPYYLNESRFAALDTGHTYAELKNTVEKALSFLSSSQNSTGGYGNAEASAQVIVALATLGEDAAAFAKNGISVLADLLSYETEEHGFSHTSNGPTNQMSTEQAAYALVAYDRYQKKQAPLYDMSDVSGVTEQFHTVEATAGSGGQITPSGQTQVKHNGSITFTITPDDGYQVQDIQVDGQSVWAGASALLANMAAVSNDALAPAPKEEQTCAEGAHIGEPIKIGERAATCTEPGYTGDVFCSSCGAVLEYGTQTDLAPHQYGNSWQSDAAGHWQVCLVCGAESALEPHEFTAISDDSLVVPDTDGDDLQQDGTDGDDLQQDGTDGDDLQQDGTNGDDLQQDGTNEDDLQQDGTDGDDFRQNGAGGDGVTSVIGVAPILFQSFGSSNAQSILADEAAQACSVCGYETGVSEESVCSHTGGTATCTTKAICTDCGLPYGDCAEHVYSQWDYSNNIHWLKCASCGLEDTTSVAIHEWALGEQLSTENECVYVCVDCGAERTETAAVSMPMLANAVLTSANSTNVQTYTLEKVTKDHRVYVTFEKLSPVIEQEVQQSGGTQTAVITADAITEAVKAVTETSASSIVIRPTQVSESISAVNVQLPAGAVGTIVGAGANVELETAKGNVTLPSNALSSIQSQGGSTAPLVICVEEKSSSEIASQIPNGTELTGSVAVEVTVMAGNSEVTTFGGAQLTVMIPVDGKFTAGQQYEVLVISSNGAIEYLTGKCGTSGSQRYVTVKVNHLSTFVVLADTSVQQSYTITATAGAGGTISPYGEVEVQAGQSQTFRITPKDGYVVADVLVDWKSVGAVESYTFRSVDEDHEIRATFRRGTEIPDFGAVVGSIYISVENNTYRGGDFTGTLVSGWYDLCARDTMMTSVLKALALGGYSWWGTGASDTGGYDITYLAGIYVDKNGNGRYDSGEPSLAEFDGARGAGWMGTLNDWFVNEGFQSFRASGSGSYELADGDYLNIVYTCNLGEDVGSLWGNTDTSLAALRISGGTLRPSFDGDTHEYSLSISGSSARITVTPTAVNKNYMVKTFLNDYNRSSAYYKRTESITVKPGDILYIGVGEPSWPSMNNQGADAVDYQATKYVITVVNSNNAEAVIEMIEALPEITYANYKTQAAKVSAARAAYHALSSDAKAKVNRTLLDKLEEAEAKVKFYEQIDDVKELLRALPKVDRGSTPSTRLIQQVKEAAAAYKNLNEKQKTYITAEDAERYEALRLWLIETGVVKPDELPVIDGNFVMPELDGIEILLEPKATVDSNGKAVATVTSAEFNALLDEAVEASATLIVIAPTGAERATDISVELPRRALSGVIDETDAGLAVRTHLGETNIPNSTLAKILEEANGQDLTVRMEEHPASEARTLLANKADIPADRLEDASVTEVTITSGSKSITSFGGRAITLLLPVSESLFQTGERCVVYQISESGAVDELTGLCRRQNNQLWVEVTTTHLSTFVAVPPIRLPFTDVKESDWFYDAVVYAYINELFNGTSATTFSPNDTMTRAMLVTVLWRMEGEPTMNSTEPFNDVVAGNWYTNAVVWASGSGIVNGTSATTFDPDGSVTREQIAAILYRYAKTKGWDVSSASGLGSFPDSEQVSDWAARAIEWTYAEGLITGKDGGRLDPQGQASRAEVATILMRFLESRS